MHFLLLLFVGLPLLIWACNQVDKSINSGLNAHADAIGWRTNPDEMRRRAWERVASERAERERGARSAARQVPQWGWGKTIAIFLGVVILILGFGLLSMKIEQPSHQSANVDRVDAIVDDVLKNKH